MTVLNTGRVTLGTTAVEIVPARVGRVELRITLGSAPINLGPNNTVTTANGYSASGPLILMNMEGAVWGITTSTRVVEFLEIY